MTNLDVGIDILRNDVSQYGFPDLDYFENVSGDPKTSFEIVLETLKRIEEIEKSVMLWSEGEILDYQRSRKIYNASVY